LAPSEAIVSLHLHAKTQAGVPGGRPRILLIEDDDLVASIIEQTLDEAGIDCVGPFGHVEEALAAAETFDGAGAFLDVRLAGVPSTPVAEALAKREIPFAYMTTATDCELWRRGRPILMKPFRSYALVATLRTAFGLVPSAAETPHAPEA
jgi:DNA-binding response OmpR family regulator